MEETKDKLHMGVLPGTEGSNPLEWNLLHPWHVAEQYSAKGEVRVLLDPVVTILSSQIDFTPQEKICLMEIHRQSYGHRGDVQGLIFILLEIARKVGDGRITMESLSESRTSPLFLDLAQRFYDKPTTYQDGFNSLLGDFFALTDKYRDLEEDWIPLMETGKEIHGHSYHDSWQSVVRSCTSSFSSPHWKGMDEAMKIELQRRDIGPLSSHGSFFSQENMGQLYSILAEDPLRGITPMQLIDIHVLAEEFNMEWALASYDWGVMP